VLRDENEELTVIFNQKKQAIPILIVVDKETGSVLKLRPKAAANLVADYKKEFVLLMNSGARKTHKDTDTTSCHEN
jgi:hypothetical protein